MFPTKANLLLHLKEHTGDNFVKWNHVAELLGCVICDQREFKLEDYNSREKTYSGQTIFVSVLSVGWDIVLKLQEPHES